MKRLITSLTTFLLLALASPASAVTYETKLDFSMHGNLTLKVSQEGKVMEEAYDYSLDYNFVAGNLLAGKPIDIELSSGARSALFLFTPMATNNCTLKVGLGLASGRLLENDPSRWLGVIPLQILWEERAWDLGTLYHWKASASGQVEGPKLSDVGVHDELIFHAVCDDVVLDTFEFTFGYGIKSPPTLEVPQLTLRNGVAKVDLGKFNTFDQLANIRLAFYECQQATSGCEEFGGAKNYRTYQISGPLEFKVTGLRGPYFNVWVGMANDYGVSSEFSNSVLVAGTKSKKFNLQAFSGSSTKLTSGQKVKLRTELSSFGDVSSVTCVAYVMRNPKASDLAMAKSRAKAACLYAKSQSKGIKVDYKVVETKSKSNLGKVALSLSN